MAEPTFENTCGGPYSVRRSYHHLNGRRSCRARRHARRRYGRVRKHAALNDVTASFPPGAVGLLGPNGAGKSTMHQDAARLRHARSRPDAACSGSTSRMRRSSIRARIGYMPESDAHIPGMNAVSFVAYCGELGGPAARRRDAARARGALLRRARRSALPERRDLLDRHEAAHQAGAGAGARSRPAVSRRADQRHGPQGPRRDARARSRPRPQQGRQPDPLVASAARRRVHLRSRRRHGQGAGSRRRARSPR